MDSRHRRMSLAPLEGVLMSVRSIMHHPLLKRPPRRIAKRARGRLAVTLALGMWMSGCQGIPPRDILEMRTENGSTIGDLIPPKGQAVLLVYPAGVCVACNTPLADWQELARSGRVSLVLVVGAGASEADRRILRIQRIPVRDFLEPDSAMAHHLPAEYVFQDGALQLWAEGAEQIGKKRLWRRIAPQIQAGDRIDGDRAGR